MIHWGKKNQIVYKTNFNLILSDDEIDEDENDSEAPEVCELKTKHKKTGLPLTEIKMNGDEMKIPPTDFTNAGPISAEGMEG